MVKRFLAGQWGFAVVGAVAVAPCLAADPCQSCHPKQAAAWAQSGMAASFRPAGNEPDGEFTAAGTRFIVHGSTQRMDRAGESSEHVVSWVIGSGKHASGYLVQNGDHLFQSPVCYYSNRHRYDLAPGYERIAGPDFSRSVGEQCLLCHSAGARGGKAISCERCHGSPEEHLRKPAPGSIVNPAKLSAAARDSVCEQCHLAGAARVANPGKSFGDFRPGQTLEDVFTVYTRPPSGDFRVISHAEQLRLSACARSSGGKLWCGTCHDPHPAAPVTLAGYNARCGECHGGQLPKAHPAETNCVGCHMPRREARDGGHTVFTDHRIRRRAVPDGRESQSDELIAWRAPDPAFERRNLGLAYIDAGVAARSPAQLVRGYRMLAEVVESSPDDIAALRGIGRALLLGKQPADGLRAFRRALALTPGDAVSEEDVGVACLEAGLIDEAIQHLEKALAIDPLLLTARTELRQAGRLK